VVAYADGRSVRLGDQVVLGNAAGQVVAVIDEDTYAEGLAKAEWSYLQRGVLVRFEALGLIHYQTPEPDLTLIGRAAR
jgi:hypothetical protein